MWGGEWLLDPYNGTISGAARTSLISTNTGAFGLGSTTDAANNTVAHSPAEIGRMTAGVPQIGETPTGARATDVGITISLGTRDSDTTQIAAGSTTAPASGFGMAK